MNDYENYVEKMNNLNLHEKEPSGLEAWKLFLDDVEQCVQSGGIHYINHKNKEIVEKALKRLEDIDSILNNGGGLWAENGIISKKLKALEIIFKKFVSPQDFILCNYTLNDKKWLSYEEYKKAYMKYYEDDKYLLLEEEYDLLKEVSL